MEREVKQLVKQEVPSRTVQIVDKRLEKLGENTPQSARGERDFVRVELRDIPEQSRDYNVRFSFEQTRAPSAPDGIYTTNTGSMETSASRGDQSVRKTWEDLGEERPPLSWISGPSSEHQSKPSFRPF